MKKAIFLLVGVLCALNMFGCFTAFAATDSVYQLVCQTVSQAYGVNVQDYAATELDDGTIHCTFKGGYALVESTNDGYAIQKLCCDTTAYFANYLGATNLQEQTRTVSYTNKSESNKSLALKNPTYLIPGVTCVPNAAICLIGYYDRYHDNLIPNFTAGRSYGNLYMYLSPDSNVQSAAIQLAYDMGVSNPATDGVTITNFKNGMQNYCGEKSLSVSFTSCMSWGSFDYNKAKAQLNANVPLIVFMGEFGVSVINAGNNNVDTVTTYTANAAHAMAVFGYTEITYTLSNGATKTDKYLRVANGLSGIVCELVNIELNNTFDDAYAVTIN